MAGSGASIRSVERRVRSTLAAEPSTGRERHGKARKVLDSAPFQPRGQTGARVQDDPSTTEQPHAVRIDDPGATRSTGSTPWVASPSTRPRRTSGSARSCALDRRRRSPRHPRSRRRIRRTAAPPCSEPVPQSLRQQELVCLTSGHVNCPRYLRGAMTVAKPLDRVPAARIVTPAIAGSVLALIGCLPPVGRVRRRQRRADPDGGRDRPVRPARSWARSRPPRRPRRPRPRRRSPPRRPRRPQRRRRARPRREPDAHAEPDRAPSPTPSPASTATPAPTPKPTAKPSSSRYALLKPCPGTPDCYIYVVRSGDNLFSIANYFGVPLTTVKALNPWTADGLKAGRGLRIPPPTR